MKLVKRIPNSEVTQSWLFRAKWINLVWLLVKCSEILRQLFSSRPTQIDVQPSSSDQLGTYAKVQTTRSLKLPPRLEGNVIKFLH